MSGGIIGNNQKGSAVCNYGTFHLQENGTIAHNANASSVDNDSKGTFTMDGGTIRANNAQNNYATGVYNNGIFYLNDGLICDGRTYSGCAGVYNGNTMIMRGGTISYNYAYDCDVGGVQNSGTMELRGGNIINNTSTEENDSVGINGNMPTVICGNPIVQYNCWYTNGEERNIYVSNNRLIPLDPEQPLQPGAKIGVWSNSTPSDTNTVFVTDTIPASSSYDFYRYFLSDDPDYGSKYKSDETTKQAILVVPNFTVERYLQNADDDNYSLVATEADHKGGGPYTSDYESNSTTKDANGNIFFSSAPYNGSITFVKTVHDNETYTQNGWQRIKIADGDTIKTYYTRKEYKLSLSKGSNITNLSGAGAYRFGKTVTLSATAPEGYTVTWKNGDDVVATGSPATFTMPAAATTLQATATIAKYAVTLNTNDGTYTNGYTAPTEYTPGTEVTLPAAEQITKPGYRFDGWYDNAEFTGDAVTSIPAAAAGDKTYYAKWQRTTTPLDPKAAAYKVEHYKEQLDGSYVLADTDFPPYSTIGSTVTASPKTYDYYTEDTTNANRIFSGTVVTPTEADGKLQVLTLKLYYKLNTHNVSYDLNGGTGAEGADYTAATIKHGTAVNLNAAPSKTNYVFTGWSDGTTIYPVGTQITPSNDITLTVQWQPIDEWIAAKLKIKVDVQVSENAAAAVSDKSKTTLADDAKKLMTQILQGENPKGFENTASELRTLLNKGASEIDVKLTVAAKLEQTPTEGELKKLIGEAFTSGEEAQKWDLSVSMTTTALNGTTELGKVENVAITETSPLAFTLTTGHDLSSKNVRVLHVLDNNGTTETVDSSITNAADGIVSFSASKFSPYVILSKTRSSGSHHSSSSSTTYTIKASAGTGGSISPTGSVSISKGASKTFTITAKDGYEISDVLVDGKSVGAKSSYTFENISASHTIAAQFRKTETVDVTDPAVTGVAGSLQTNAHNVYLRGYPNGSFGPNSQMTRAEAAQMFYNLLIKQDMAVSASFSDVADSAWYAPAVKTLASMDIIKGVGGDRFAPERSITRAEFAAIATRFAKTDNSGSVAFRDVENSDWFYSSVLTAVNYGWINGYSDNIFRPGNTITRAEVAAIVNRMLARAGDTVYAGSHANKIKQFTDVSDTFWGYSDIIEATNAHDYSKTSGTESWK